MSVSGNIKRLRTQNDMTQEELAEKMFVSRQTVSSWETGRNQPDVETLTALAAIFSTDVNELIYGNPKGGYQRFQKRYIRTLIVFSIILLAAVMVNSILITYKHQIRDKYAYADVYIALAIIVPIAFEVIISFCLGVMTLSFFSLFTDCHIKRRALAGIVGILLLVPFFVCIADYIHIYCNIGSGSGRSIILYYMLDDRYSWIRIILTWCFPHIAGVLIFLFFNKQRSAN